MKGKWILAKIPWVLGGIVFTAAIALLFGLAVMILWNWLAPAIFGLSKITYWQAWGLVLLAHILFRGGRGSHWRRKGHSHGSGDWEREFKERMGKKFGKEGHEWSRHGWGRHTGAADRSDEATAPDDAKRDHSKGTGEEDPIA